jgi:GNAT superfamily N-acetyltransferase
MQLNTARNFVDDIAAGKAFYANAVALPIKGDGEQYGHCVFDSGRVELVVESVPPDAPAEDRALVGRFAELSFTVAGIHAKHAELTDKGARFTGAPELQAWGARSPRSQTGSAMSCNCVSCLRLDRSNLRGQLLRCKLAIEHFTQSTWQRLFDDDEPVFALVAVHDGAIVGLAHYLYHRSMTKIEPVCYLSDLFTVEPLRGRGIARTLIEAVCANAKAAGSERVYWQTHETSAAGRMLYDKLANHHGFIVYSREP